MKKIGIFTTIIALIIIIGAFIYFVSGVSSTYAPIEKYEYSGSINQFITSIKNYTSANPDVTFKITDTTGNRKDDYAIYMSIDMQVHTDSVSYDLECEKSNGSSTKTTVQLVKAYNKTKITGGYSKEAKGIEPLVNNFDVNFLKPLEKSQNIIITPL